MFISCSERKNTQNADKFIDTGAADSVHQRIYDQPDSVTSQNTGNNENSSGLNVDTEEKRIESKFEPLEGFLIIDVKGLYLYRKELVFMDMNGKDSVRFDNGYVYIENKKYEIMDEEHLYTELINIETYYPDYGLFILKCFGRKGDNYIVELNGDSTLVNGKSFLVEFKDYKKFIFDAMFLKDTKENPFRTHPSDSSDIIKEDDYGFYAVDIQGDWVKGQDYKEGCIIAETPSPVDIFVWIRWRKDGKYILEVNYSC